ncbi:MAG: hypothetical protein ABIG84_00430 [archaeon]
MVEKNGSLADTLTVTGKQEQLDSQKKVLELDIDKRIFVLEESVEKLKDTLLEANEMKDLKDSLARLKEMKGKLREMEDLGFITKLETIQTQDEVLALTDDQSILKGKLDLLSSAIKIISTKMPGNSKDAGFVLKRDTDNIGNIELSVHSLKSDVESLKKRLGESDPDAPVKKLAELEAKFNYIESEFKKFITDVRADLERKDEGLKSVSLALKSGAANGASLENSGAAREEVNSLRSVIDKVESLVKATNDGVRGVECRLDESNKKVNLRLNEQDKVMDGLRSIDQKVVGLLNSKVEHIKKDVASHLHDMGRDEMDKLRADISGCREETQRLSRNAGLLDEIKRKVEGVCEKDELTCQRVDSLEAQAGSLKALKARVEEFDVQITDLAKKWAAFESIKGQLQNQPRGGSNPDYIRYVPVLKENVSKLYRVYNRAEKRISEMESGINEIRAMKAGKDHTGAPMPSGWEEMIKTSVDSELTDVVENINALSADIKSRIETDARMQSVQIDNVKADFEAKISSLKMDIDEISKRKRVENVKSNNYEEFAELKARMLAELDALRREMKGFEKKISSDLLENIVENKLVPHVCNQDKIAKSLTLLNRKVDQSHIDVSKNAHEKISSSVKPIMDRISEIESDVNLLKDTRVDLVDDVTQVIERLRASGEVAGALPQDIMRKYDERFLELAEKIELLQSRSGMSGAELEQKLNALQYESDVLRQELERVKELYFEMLEKEKSAPVIIE